MVIAVLVEVSRYPIRPLALHRIIMPSASLIPDRQLTFSPELAEIIGLEEAVLLQELGAQLTDRDEWTSLSLESLQRNLSFWSADHIALLIDKLVTLGIVNRAPGDNADTVLLSAAAAASAIQQATAVSPSLTAGASDSLWQPSDALQELLVLNHAIPRSFVDSAKTHFVPTQGSEVDTQFRQYILGRWRDTQRLEARQQPSQAFEIAAPAPFGRDWTPNQDALEILEQAGIDIVFAESVRSEFILYWSERGGPPKEVNSRFVEHVRRRWL